MDNVNDILQNLPAINVKEENGQQLVSARELLKNIGLSTRFSRWVEQNFGQFEKDVDFTSVKTFTLVNNGAKRDADMSYRDHDGAWRYFPEALKVFQDNALEIQDDDLGL